MSTGKISLPVIRRLPRYQRYVASLVRAGVGTVSSNELARLLGTTASQVRQDLNCFGGFGQQGVGYKTDLLLKELDNLLFGGEVLNTVVIGTGRLGRAVANFLATAAPSFSLVAAFDSSPAQIGTELGDLRVLNVAELVPYCKENRPHIAVLCTPSEGTISLAGTLAQLGFKGIWNFSHYDLSSAELNVIVENVHLGDSLSGLGFRVRNTALESE